MFLWGIFDVDDVQWFSPIFCEKSNDNDILEFSLRLIET